MSLGGPSTAPVAKAGLGPERFPREAAQECESCIHEVLAELAKLPECAEANWLERLEEKEG
jgi:hypothetical protein